MTVEMHDVVLALNQPGDASHPLLVLLQQLLTRPLPREAKAAPLLKSLRVLIIDSHQQRAQAFAQLLARAGYKPAIAPTSLDAFTLFVQGTFHPFAILMDEAGPANNQFFLTRLSQQFQQRYDWNVPFIRVQMQSSTLFTTPHATGPLAPSQQSFARKSFPIEQPTQRRWPTSPSSHPAGHPTLPLDAPTPRSSPTTPLPPHPLAPRSLPSLPSPSNQARSGSLSTPPLSQSQEAQPSTPLASPTQKPRERATFPSAQPTLRQRPLPTAALTDVPAPAPVEQSLKMPALRPTQIPPRPVPQTPVQTISTGPLSPPSAPLPSLMPPLPAIPTTPDPLARRQGVSRPSASTMKFTKKQVEKIALSGVSIGRYQLESVIGGNPIGDVYLTYDRLREHNIALKTIQTNMIPFHLMEGLEEDYNLFQYELDLLQQPEHPHLGRVMNIGKSYISGFPFIYKTMPLYTEGSLATWQISFASKLFAPSEVVQVVLQVADAVYFLHERGILYQNFKLTNIMVTNKTQTMRDMQIVLADLPFVRDVMNLPRLPESYRYIAPEQWDGVALPASDQYGLAVLAYELLTGRPPFQGNSDAVMRRMHLTMPPPAPSSINHAISPLVDNIILRALSKQPTERFASITAFATTLERAAG